MSKRAQPYRWDLRYSYRNTKHRAFRSDSTSQLENVGHDEPDSVVDGVNERYAASHTLLDMLIGATRVSGLLEEIKATTDNACPFFVVLGCSVEIHLASPSHLLTG